MYAKNKRDKLSVFISLILRHKPEQFGVVLDDFGFCYLEDLLYAIHTQERWNETEMDDIFKIVEECSKQRYEIVDGKIRARYGHSCKRIPLKEGNPPATLIHGTHEGAVGTIMADAVKKMGREYVHLSEGEGFATLAAKRRGKPVMIYVDTQAAQAAGLKFYFVGNDVWLSDDIPAKFLRLDKEKSK